MTTDIERELGLLAATLRPSTVSVRSEHDRGSGSGVVWSRAGTIVTNAHVARSRTVAIELFDGRRLRGAVVRRDDARDLAEIAVEAGELAAVSVRSPADLRVGEVLVAFGHPLGVPNVLTTGIAFGPHRAGSDRFVRADVRLAPGNSGGALADVHGRVVGINSMIAGGLALAIPSDDVRRFLGEALPVSRLGVTLVAVQPARLGAFAVVSIKPGSTAERSGLMLGDVVAGRHIRTLSSASRVQVVRGGQTLVVPIVRSAGDIAAAA